MELPKRLPTLEESLNESQSEEFVGLDQMKTNLKPVEDWLKKEGFKPNTKYGANVDTSRKRETSTAWEKDGLLIIIFHGQFRDGRYVKDPYFEASIKPVGKNQYYHDPSFMSSKSTSNDLIQSLKKHVPLAAKGLNESDSKVYENDDMYQPPSGAAGNAQKVLDWRDEHGDEVAGMTQTGWTRANQLASGDKVSRDIVGRMAAFARHEKNSSVSAEHKDEPWKDAGYVAWLGWGGDTGINWAKEIVANEKD